MGSKSSKTSNEKEVKLKPQVWGFNTYQKNNNYDESYSTSQNTQSETNNTIKSSSKKTIEKKYPFKFEWKGNGKSVLLAGNFLDNWTNTEVLVKNNDTGAFELLLYLPKGKHQFKFIVDNKWTCSNQYPTMADERGIINNFIDLTNYSPPENLIVKNSNKKNNEYSNRLPLKSELNLTAPNVIEHYRPINNEYNTRLPLNCELNLTAPNIIEHYRPKFNLDYQSNQGIITKKKYLKYKEKNLMNENNTYKKILVFPHEKLMHLCPNLNGLNSKGNNDKHDFIKISTTIRNKHKFLTTIYYRPI